MSYPQMTQLFFTHKHDVCFYSHHCTVVWSHLGFCSSPSAQTPYIHSYSMSQSSQLNLSDIQILTSAHYEDRLHSLICLKHTTVCFSLKSKVCNVKLYSDKSSAAEVHRGHSFSMRVGDLRWYEWHWSDKSQKGFRWAVMWWDD